VITAAAFVFAYGATGMLAWSIAALVWARAAANNRLAGWDPSELFPVAMLCGSFTTQLWINTHVPLAGDAVFLACHFVLVTRAVRASSFPRARLVRKPCSNG
jgi:hypothetical protein